MSNREDSRWHNLNIFAHAPAPVKQKHVGKPGRLVRFSFSANNFHRLHIFPGNTKHIQFPSWHFNTPRLISPVPQWCSAPGNGYHGSQPYRFAAYLSIMMEGHIVSGVFREKFSVSVYGVTGIRVDIATSFICSSSYNKSPNAYFYPTVRSSLKFISHRILSLEQAPQ